MTEELKLKISRNNLIDIMILLVILCAFFAGFWYGQKQMGELKEEECENFKLRYCFCSLSENFYNGTFLYPGERQKQNIR